MSVTLLQCLRYALGITRMDCSCYNDDKPADANRSDSGLYLLETEGLNVKTLGALNDCSEGGLWAMSEWAINEAIRSVVDDLLALMGQMTDPVAPAFSGYIGETKGNQPVTSGYLFHSLRMLCRPLRGGIFRLRNIVILADTTVTFELKLYDNVEQAVIAEWDVTSQANTRKVFALPTPLKLDLYSPHCDYMRYDFVYINDGSFKPLNNQVNCGCGGASHYHPTAPEWKDSKDQWSKWILLAGAKGNDFDQRDSWTTNQEANGIALEGDLYCNGEKVFCNTSMNFEADPLARVLAWAIRFRAAAFLTSKLLNHAEPSRFVATGREQMQNNYKFYTEQSNARLVTLAEEYTKPQNINRYADCFNCRPWMRKSGIR